MPQVHNRQSVFSNDPNAFGKNSRYTSTERVTEGSKRRIRAFNVVENRLTKYKLNFYKRHETIELRRRRRETDLMLEKLKKTLAYKIVLGKHNVTNAPDYNKALDGDYSREALKNDVKNMVDYMDPDKVRERRAKALIEDNRKRYETILKRNKVSIESLCPPVKTWQRYQYDVSDDEEDDDVKDKTPSPVAFRKPLLRRQHEIAPPPMRRSPTKPTLPLRRQGITRSFMLESGQGTLDKIPLSPKKQNYELPPLQLKRQLDPCFDIAVA